MVMQGPDYYDINMAVLKQHRKGLWEAIGQFQPTIELEVIYTPEGKTNLLARKADGSIHFLHDQNDPEKEIPLFLEMVPEDADGVVLLTGMGLGYTPMAILRHRKHIRYLAVFDLSLDIFLMGLRHMDLTKMLSDPRLILCFDPEPDLETVLEKANLVLQLENIHDLKHLPTFALNRKAYERLGDEVFSFANQYNLGGGAILGGGKTYTRNRLKNMTAMYRNCIVQNLMGKFKDIPAILVAGGPSLDKNIQFLTDAKGRAVIFAVDSVLPALVANGICPDFMTAIDPYELIYEKFADALPYMGETSLIASCWVTPKVPKIFSPEKIFWTFAGRNMENWLMEMMGGTLPTGGASTVAHLNLAAAILMGCSPIVFVGQDLSYTTGSSHAVHTSLKQDRAVKNLLNSKDLMWAEEINGGKVPTDRKMLNFKKYFEHLICQYPGLYINATFQGVKIEGTEAMDLDRVIQIYCSQDYDIGGILRNASKPLLNDDLFQQNYTRFLKETKIIIKEIEKANRIQKKAINTLSKTGKKQYRQFLDLPQVVQKQLNDIDRCHEKIDSYTRLWGILDEVTMEGLKKSERQKFVIEKLAGNPETYTEWMVKCLERLNYINKVRKKELKSFSADLPRLSGFIEKEQKLKRKVDQKGTDHDAVLALMDHYFSHGEYGLLEQTDKEYGQELNHPGMYFFRGCFKLLKNEFEAAESLFDLAKKEDPGLEKRTRLFRTGLGDASLGYADFFQGKDENTVRRMLIKGLQYSGQHRELCNRLLASAENDIASLENAVTQMDRTSSLWKEAFILGRQWCRDITAHPAVKEVLGKIKCASFYKFYGNMLVAEGSLSAAKDIFGELLFLVSDNPEYHLLMADACFGTDDFDGGVAALEQAVLLDRSYARYWENMGDNLMAGGSFQDALAAYEKNFTALPENRGILKKIAKCYLGMGQVQAAEEALVQYRKNQK